MNKSKERIVFDVDRMMDFVFEPDIIPKDSEISETYATDDDGKLVLVSKELHEVRNTNDSEKFNVKYDFLKLMMGVVLDGSMDSDGIVFNTLENKGFIKRVAD